MPIFIVMSLPTSPLLTPYLDPTILQLQGNSFDQVDHHSIRLVTHDQYRRLSNPQSLFFMWKLLYLFHTILAADDAPFRLIEYSDRVTLSYRTSAFPDVLTFFDACNVSLKPRNIDSPISQQRADKRFSIHIFYLFKYLGFNLKETTKTWVILTIPSLTDIQTLLQSSSFTSFQQFFLHHPHLLSQPLSTNFPSLVLNIDPFQPSSPSSPHSLPLFLPPDDTSLEDCLTDDLVSLQDSVDLFIEQHPFYAALEKHSFVFRCLPSNSKHLFLTELVSFDFDLYRQ